MGQHMDYTMAHRTKNDYSLFSIDRYYSIVKHKTSYYTFNLPVVLGLLLANKLDIETHAAVREICFELGKLFQIQVRIYKGDFMAMEILWLLCSGALNRTDV